MLKNIYLLLLLNVFVSIYAQNEKLYLKCNYENISFVDFTKEMETNYGIKFYYLEEWVENIKITVKGDSLVLEDIFKSTIGNSGLFYLINENNEVFITYKEPLIPKLVQYKTTLDNEVEEENYASENGISETEKTYLESRKAVLVETIVIGKKSEVFKDKTVFVSVKIKDIETGEPLIGATIYFEEIFKGCVTDLNGHFSIALKPGKYNATVNCLGMKEIKYILEVYASGPIEIEMEKTLIPIDEVTIKADRYHNVKGMQMGFERISVKEIKKIPVVLGEKDVLKIAAMLPGVQNVGEGSAGFYVRGSSADQNMFYINKVPIYNTAHLFGFFTSFSPDIVNNFSFYKSNLPAQYGGRLSSFFDITAKQGNKKKYTARGGISPVTGHIAVEGPIKRDHSSFIVSARSTYSDWLLSRLHDPDLRNSNARFYDLASNFIFDYDENNLIKVFGYYSFDKFSLASKNQYEYSNKGLSVNWWHQYSNKHHSETSIIYSNYSYFNLDSVHKINAYQQQYKINHLEFKTDFSYIPIENHIISYGINFIRYYLDRGIIEPVGSLSERVHEDLGAENGIESAIYLADEYKITKLLSIYGGIRYSYFAFLGPKLVYEYEAESPKTDPYVIRSDYYEKGKLIEDYSGPEWRVSANFSTGPNSSIKVSYNRTRQYMFMLSNTIAISPTDQWKLCDFNIIPPISDQVSFGYYKTIYNPSIDISTEIYYKEMDNIIEYKDGADLISNKYVERDVLQGNQEAYGFEFMVKKNSGKLTGWLSYCYSRSFISVNGKYPWQKINNGITFPSNYDKPNALNCILNYKLNRRLSLSSNIVYSNGRPITYPIAIFYVNGLEQAYYSDRNKYRIPDYFRIDISVNVEGNLLAKKLTHSYFMFSIYNLTGRKNAYSVYFQSDGGQINGYKLSIFGIPIFTLSWNFKLGNYSSD
ncbi:MAG: TonB-dependent receptor [Bacteroidales bacterium]|nr:TonB-dependent receptor [Bacteroidales bacterium]